MEQKKISKSVLKRLPGYLAYLKNLPDTAPPHISATALAIKENKGSIKTEGVLSLFLVETGCIYGNMRF